MFVVDVEEISLKNCEGDKLLNLQAKITKMTDDYNEEHREIISVSVAPMSDDVYLCTFTFKK